VLTALVSSSICTGTAHAQGAVSPAPPVPHRPAAPGRDLAHEPAREPDDDAPGATAAPRHPAPPAEAKARLTWLRERVTAAFAAQPRLAVARTAVSVIDLATGAELVARDADRAMTLASTAKLLTSAAALAVLGGGFRWRTGVYGAAPDARGTVAGDLYVRGRGDPMLSAADLDAIAADLVARGVRAVDRLVIDDRYFDDVVDPPHFAEQPNETAGFRAPVAAFGVARSTITITVIADPGGAARAAIDPSPGDYIKLVDRGTTSVTRGRTRLAIDVHPRADDLEVSVAGQIRWGEGSWEVRKRIPDPTRFAGEVFRQALAGRGVKIKDNAIALGAVPANAALLAVHESVPLTEVLRHMNKLSDNYLAESVLKTLGAETRRTPGPATWDDGRAALHAYLASIGMPESGYRADNGSGLFDATEVSARQLTTLLRAAYSDFRVGPDLLASLPVGGVDGTLARRWHGRAANGRVRAKTGTLDKVTTLAGYFAIDTHHPLGFAILVNDIPTGQRSSARTAADDIVDALAAYLGSP